jgi:hypothetical protein
MNNVDSPEEQTIQLFNLKPMKYKQLANYYLSFIPLLFDTDFPKSTCYN